MEQQSEGSNSYSEDLKWADLFNSCEGDPFHGFVVDNDQFKELRWHYEVQSKAHFVAVKTSSSFGKTENMAKHRKVLEAFENASVKMVFEMTRGNEEKTRFKRALIHFVCSTEKLKDLLFDNPKTMKKLTKLWKSKEEIPFHDDIIKVEDLVEYNQLTTDDEEGEDSDEDEIDAPGGFGDFGDDFNSTVKSKPPSNEKEQEKKTDWYLGNQGNQENVDVQKDEDHMYSIKKKGLAIVLYNTEFLKPDGTLDNEHRRTSIGNIDAKLIEKILPKFDIEILDGGAELTKDGVKEFIPKVKAEIEKRKPDIFFCVVSTHGGEFKEARTTGNRNPDGTPEAYIIRHQLYFKDILTDQPLFTDWLIGQFSNEECPSLAGKPRLFFLQACSSRDDVDAYDEGAEVAFIAQEDVSESENASKQTEHEDKEDARARLPPKVDQPDVRARMQQDKPIGEVPVPGQSAPAPDIPENIPEKIVIPKYEITPSMCYQDCLVMFSSPPGKKAFGRVLHGGWLIESIEKAFEFWMNNPEHDITEILTRANWDMVETKTLQLNLKDGTKKEYKVVPCIQHMLTKELRLKALKREPVPTDYNES